MSKVVNESGIEPVGHAVLLLPYNPEVESSVIELPPDVKRGLAMIEARAIVVSVGPEAWKGKVPRAKVGDKVLISKFCGAMLRGPWDDKQYRMINDEDIYAVITKEKARG